MLKHAALLSLCAALGACTIIQVEGATPSTSAHFGILRLQPDAQARSISYRIRGIGIVPGMNGFTLGYSQEDTILVFSTTDCRVVVFEAPAGAESRRVLESLLENPNLCRTGGLQ